jgi:omega-amidase
MHVTCVQFDVAWEDKPANFERARTLLDPVDLPAGGLVVLPEMFATGFSMNVDAIAEGDIHLAESFLASLALERGVFTLGGVVNRSATGKGLNQAVLFDPAGVEVARYSKMHPFSFGQENRHYERGDALAVVPGVGCLTVAPLICYDLRFPEAFRAAVRRGTQAFVVIASWPAPRAAHWTALLVARAIENQAYVVGVNRCGRDPNLAYAGGSMIVDSRGQVLAAAGEGPAVIQADLPVQPLLDYRASFPALADMHPAFLKD